MGPPAIQLTIQRIVGMLRSMADNFKLTPSGPSTASLQVASEMLQAIQGRGKGTRRPVLVAWSLRIPVGVHRQLQKAAEKHEINMTDIVVEALRRTLPALLSEDELKNSAAQAEEES